MMQKFKRNNYFTFSGPRDHTVKVVGIMFTILAAILVGIGSVSFIGAQEIEKNYNLHLSKTIEKLEIINKLHRSNDKAGSLITRITSIQPTDKKDLIKELQATYTTDNQLINQLEAVTAHENNRHLLRQLIRYHKVYYSHADSIATLALSGRVNGAALYKSMYLAPVEHLYDQYLSRLNDNFRKVMDWHDSQSAQLLSSFVRNQEILLVLVLLTTGCAVFLVQHLFRKLKSENIGLANEIKKRQELQNELYKSQHVYKTLFDSNPIPMWIYDSKTLKILRVNNAASVEYGYTIEEFLEKKISDFEQTKDIGYYSFHVLPHPSQQTIPHEAKHKRKNGSSFRVEIHSHALPEEEGLLPGLMVAVNVEDRLSAMEKIERNEKLLREVSSSIPGAVYKFHTDTDGNFKFPYVSDGLISLCGLSPNDLYHNASTIFERIHPEDKEVVFESLERSITFAVPWYAEARLWNSAENKWKWVRGHSLPTLKRDGSVHFNGTLIDITLQKEAQEELVRQEANLRALLDSSSSSIFMLDQDLTVIAFNKFAKEEVMRCLFRDLEEGQSFLDLVNEDKISELKQDHAQAMQGKEIIFETGSTENWYKLAYKPAISKDNRVLAVALTIHNVTEQRNIIEAIRKSEAHLTKAQELTKLGSWEFDLEKQTLTTSESLCHIYGIPSISTVFPYSTFQFLDHPDDVDTAERHLRAAVAAKTGMAYDHKIILSSREVKHLHTIGEIIYDSEGKPIRISGATQDITELKLREQEAREAKGKLQATLENIPEIIFSTDAALNMTYVSPQVKKITGYDEKELLGSAALWLSLIHPDDVKQFLSTVMPSVPTGNKLKCELRFITKSGEIKWTELRYSTVVNNSGNVIRIDGSATDITEKKQEEVRRAILTEQLQIQNHHLQQFAYIISHNLRAPIANILGLSSIYDRKRPEATVNLRVIDNLTESARLLDSTIRDLNEILTIRSRVDEGKEKIDLKLTLEHVLTSVSYTKTLEETDIDYDFNEAPNIVAIKSYIHSILYNLITNALKFRSDNRKLKLRLKTFKVYDYICLEIEDNGQGIDLEKERDKIFGLYKRFHHNREGKGIGLYLVKTQAELLDGKVEVESQPDLGTKFKVYFKQE